MHPSEVLAWGCSPPVEGSWGFGGGFAVDFFPQFAQGLGPASKALNVGLVNQAQEVGFTLGDRGRGGHRIGRGGQGLAC